jgi:hypothetical protein
MQSVPMITNVMSSNLVQAIQHYVIQFASDLWHVGGFLSSSLAKGDDPLYSSSPLASEDSFLCALRFPPPIKLTLTI